jgi:LCP family protein required for cell wall assembly
MTLLFSGTGIMGGMTSADAVRVLRIDFDAQKVTIVAFPRDLVVKVTGLESLNIKNYRLGPAFHEKRRISTGTEKDRYIAATTVLAQALYDNFGVVPTHYITVNLEPWSRMIDTIGGVDINLPAQLKLYNGMYLQAGPQTLDGNLSKEYIRTFTGAGETDRFQRQNLFVKALSQKVMSGQTLPKIPALLQDFNQAIITDLSPEQLLALGCLSEKIPSTYTAFYEVNADSYTLQQDGAMLPNFDKIRLLVKAALGY